MFHLSGTLRVPAPIPSPSPTNTQKKTVGFITQLPVFSWVHCLTALGPTRAGAPSSGFPPGVGSPPSTPQTTRPVAVSESDAQAGGERERGRSRDRTSPVCRAPSPLLLALGLPLVAAKPKPVPSRTSWSALPLSGSPLRGI